MDPCKRPLPVGMDKDKKPLPRVICGNCGNPLGVIVYESNGALMTWWRHAPALVMAGVA